MNKLEIERAERIRRIWISIYEDSLRLYSEDQNYIATLKENLRLEYQKDSAFNLKAYEIMTSEEILMSEGREQELSCKEAEEKSRELKLIWG